MRLRLLRRTNLGWMFVGIKRNSLAEVPRGTAFLCFLIEFFMNPLAYPQNSVFPQAQRGAVNMYVDIASFFNCVYQEFLGAGSVLFEKRKKEYLQGAYGIRDVAQRYSTQVYLPMNGTRPNTWLKPLSVVESDKLRDIADNIQTCAAMVGSLRCT